MSDFFTWAGTQAIWVQICVGMTIFSLVKAVFVAIVSWAWAVFNE